MSQTNLEKWLWSISSWWVLFSNPKSSKEYQTGDCFAWKQVIDCNSCIQWAIKAETDYTCSGKFGLYLDDERIEYADAREEYDYMKSLLNLWGENEVPSVRNHAYKFNWEKHAQGEVVMYPRLDESEKITCIWILNSNNVYCKWWKLVNRWWTFTDSDLLRYYNENNLRQRTIYNPSMTSSWLCGTSTIKTIYDRYVQDATMSNMFIHYLENNGMPWIIYLLKSAKDAGITVKEMMNRVTMFQKWLKWPKNSNKSLATSILADVKFPPQQEANIIDEDNRKKIENGMLKAFRVPPEMLWESSAIWSQAKYEEMEKIYQKTVWSKSQTLYEDSINEFTSKYPERLLYPNLSLMEFRCEREPTINLEEAREEVKLWLMTIDEYRELVWREPIETPEEETQDDDTPTD